MKYLKPLLQRVTTDARWRSELEALPTDRAVMAAILSRLPFQKLADEFEKYYGVTFVNLDAIAIDQKVLAVFDAGVLKNIGVIPYRYDSDQKTYYFAMENFLSEELRQNITRSCKASGTRARFSYAPKEWIVEKYDRLMDVGGATDTDKEPDNESEQTNTTHADGDFNAGEWIDNILNAGIDMDASDIHIERFEHYLQVRFRVDGRMSCKQIHRLSDSNLSNIYVRLKVISGLDISEKRKPQDGRIDNYEHNGSLYDLRVSTVSTVHGEKAVMRISNRSSRILTFEELGFTEADAVKVRKILNNKNGIVYIAGATGSGKTTTLYAMIDELNDDAVNVYTIENPVERSIENVNQIQVDPLAGITYASTLKALLRQDPDVIVVGEIRDKETAELSVQSSLTGHLVLSTIHANNALESINRLLNMGVEPYLIVGSSLGFLSQRLVRKLCNHCKQPHTAVSMPEKAWLAYLSKEYGVAIDGDFYEAVGCEHCIDGYKGRVAVVEIIDLTEDMKEMILKTSNLRTLKAQALKDGFKPLAVNGLEIAAAGITTIDELMREITK